MTRRTHPETHMVHRIGWLRAAVLGANDGLVSTASLVVGVAAAGSGRTEIMIAGLARFSLKLWIVAFLRIRAEERQQSARLKRTIGCMLT